MSYAQLVTDIGSYTNRTDLSSMIPRFVAMAEAKMNRRLRLRQQEEVLAAQTITGAYEVALPSDYLETKTITLDGRVGWALEESTREQVESGRGTNAARMYTVTDAAWLFDGAGDVTITYYKSIPGLQVATTNWLETLHPDLYLQGALEQAYIYLRDEKEELKSGGKFDAMLTEIQRMKHRTGAALLSRKG